MRHDLRSELGALAGAEVYDALGQADFFEEREEDGGDGAGVNRGF